MSMSKYLTENQMLYVYFNACFLQNVLDHTGKNQQPWYFYMVNIMKRIFKVIPKVKDLFFSSSLGHLKIEVNVIC